MHEEFYLFLLTELSTLIHPQTEKQILETDYLFVKDIEQIDQSYQRILYLLDQVAED